MILSNSSNLLNVSGALTKTPSHSLNRSASFGRRKSSSNNLNLSQLNRTPGLNRSQHNNTTNALNCSKLNKTPNKSGRLTPSRNPKTPVGTAGDRYIPNRSLSMMDLGHFMISQNDSQQSTANTSTSAPTSPHKQEYERAMRHNLTSGMTSARSTDNLNQTAENSFRILAYQKSTAPRAPLGFTGTNQVLYTGRPTLASSCQKTSRHIPSAPERVLDAPDIVDDYYLNLIDWGPDNWMAVALGGQVFLWCSESGDIKQLLELESTTDYVSAVKFSEDGRHIAVAVSTGEVQLWHVVNTQRLRSFTQHRQRVASMAWNEHILVSGAKDGLIHQNDVRRPDPLQLAVNEHTQEVCGLVWSPDGKLLASGGNDNKICIWRCADGEKYTESSPLHIFTDHLAAVKALAWCPWQPSVLATGGGTADRMIRFWNCNTGQCIAQTDTEAQVVSLAWSAHYKELISALGYPSCSLVIWKYPAMTRIAELKGHENRLLAMTQSPCGEFVMSLAADESLRLWHCFAVDAATKKKQQRQNGQRKQAGINGGLITRGIR